MHILVFNAGSSSLKFGVFRLDAEDGAVEVFKGSYERFREGRSEFRFRRGDADERGTADIGGIDRAIEAIPGVLHRFGLNDIGAIGHRVVHGGARFSAATILDDATVAEIDALTPLAPLHNPANLRAVRLCRKLWPDLPQVAVFDTAFHATNPPFATTYAVPKQWRDAGLRRYGFHGTSHRYVAQRAAQEIGRPLSDLQIVSVHLGNGASVCAINRGQSMDSSMGMTPLEGLVMGTRSGDVDPGAFGFLSRQFGLSVEAIETALNNDSGLKGLTGSSDMRDLEDRAAKGDPDAQLAIEIFAYRARKYVGAYAAAMGGIDAVVFTGGIGENSATVRAAVLARLGLLGVDVDKGLNLVTTGGVAGVISRSRSPAALVIPTDEERMIACDTAEIALAGTPVAYGMAAGVAA